MFEINVNTQSGKMEIIDLAETSIFHFKNGVIRVALSKSGEVNWYSSEEYPIQTYECPDNSCRWTMKGHPEAPDLELTHNYFSKDIKFRLKATNSTGKDMIILGAEIPAFSLEFAGGLTSSLLNGEFKMLQNGYQSWSFSGPLDIRFGSPGLKRGNGTIQSGGDNDDWFGDQPGLSWWVTALNFGYGTLVAGALSAGVFKTYLGVEFAPEPGILNFRIVEGMTGDQVVLAPEASFEFEPVYFVGVMGGYSGTMIGLDYYARAAAEITPPLVWNGDHPWGWASWYYYYSQVKEKDLIENLDFLREELSAYGFNLIQLDDGYMPRWGEWTNNSKFPSGLDGVAGEIESAGLWPGIWIAPFLVSMDSDLVDSHPDWFLRDRNGDLIVYQQPPSATHAILDVTHPDAETWLKGMIGGIREAGFRMIKIDFIFAEAFEGVRYDPKVTSMQAYHRGLEIIRKAAGEDMFILACGAPMLPTLGYAHAFRTGPDIAFEAVGGGNPNYNFLVHEARNTASRFFTGGNWFLNDPDQLLLREPLNLEEAKMFAVANVMAGGVFLLGDNLAGLAEDRLAIVTNPVILEMAKIGKPAIPLDLFNAASQTLFSSPVMDLAGETQAPSIWWLEDADRASFLAFFNWKGDARVIEIETGWLSSSSPRDIVEAFSGEKVKVKDDKISARVESRQVKLFRIRY
jgi:hypothetical protein